MTPDFAGYVPYPEPYGYALAECTWQEARREFEYFFSVRHERLAHLARLVGQSGIELGHDDSSLQALNDWFVDHVTVMPGSTSGELLPPWRSVVVDISIAIGEAMIQRSSTLRWELCDFGGKKYAFYHQPVILGFSKVDPKHRLCMGTDLMVQGYAVGVVEQKGARIHLGTVEVRGVRLDLDEIVASHIVEPIDRQYFVRIVRNNLEWA